MRLLSLRRYVSSIYMYATRVVNFSFLTDHSGFGYLWMHQCILMTECWRYTNTHKHKKSIFSNVWTFQPTHIYIYIYIIMSYRRHRYPWPSLATSPYRSSPLTGLQGHIPYSHIAAGCMFELIVLLLPGHIWGSIGVHHLWARPCFSSSDLHVWFV